MESSSNAHGSVFLVLAIAAFAVVVSVVLYTVQGGLVSRIDSLLGR